MLNNSVTGHSLKSHAEQVKNASILGFFEQDPERLNRLSVSHEDLYFDASKSLIDQKALDLLLAYAKEAELEAWRAKMFAGEAINSSEGRAVLHTALRAEPPRSEVLTSLHKMKKFSQDIRDGIISGATGKTFDTVVNIGIGGSDLGPRMAYQALKDKYPSKIKVHYVSNVDGHDLDIILKGCIPETTLFLVASKTFTTIETLTNAESARIWLVKALGQEAVSKHFAALSTNLEKVKAFGIDAENMFPFEEWVGGRYSLWSSIGLSVCIGLGFDVFAGLLSGARNMDRHFQEAPLEKNIPVLMGLIGFWYSTYLNFKAYACLPYDQRLAFLPLWLQQLDMESNGKSISRSGQSLSYATGPIVFGQPGTNGQHAFYQHIHQSKDITPCEFIGFLQPDHGLAGHHKILLANMIAQAQALMCGQSAPEGKPYSAFSGNRPSMTLLFPTLSAYTLGQLLALYEHKIFVQGILWEINSFDQWGVELGKVLARKILETSSNSDTLDPSTEALLKRCSF